MFYWASDGCHLLDVDYGEDDTMADNITVVFEFLLRKGGLLEESLDLPIFEQALPRLGPPAGG